MIAYSQLGEELAKESEGSARQDPAASDLNGQNPTAPLRAHLAELQDYVAFYLSTKADALKLQVRTVLIYAALGIVAAIVGAGALTTAVVLALNGVANGLAHLLGGRLWAGQLITGSSILLILAAAIILGMRYVTNSSRKKTKEKYDHWRDEQRTRFGHDVGQRAAENIGQ
jgi:hypothetical protein